MKLYKTLFLLSLFLISCSSDDNNSDDNDNDINTEVQISISGNDIEDSTFNDNNLSLTQQCEIFELWTNVALQNASINISYFLLQFGDVQFFQINNPGEAYNYNGPNAYLTAAQAEINSEVYSSTSLTFEITSEPYNQEGGCASGDFGYWDQVFNLNFTIVLESSNNNLSPISLTGSIVDFPINPNACAC